MAFVSLSEDADDVRAMKEVLGVLFLKEERLKRMKGVTIREDC